MDGRWGGRDLVEDYFGALKYKRTRRSGRGPQGLTYDLLSFFVYCDCHFRVRFLLFRRHRARHGA